MKTSFRKAIIASILMHLGIFVFFYYSSFVSKEEKIPEQKINSIEIVLIKPQPSPAPVEDSVDEPVIAEVPVEVPIEAPLEVPVENLVEEQPSLIVDDSLNEEALPALVESIPAPPITNNENIVLTRELLNNSVKKYISGYKTTLSRQWLDECLRYKNRHGTKTCPQEENAQSTSNYPGAESIDQMFDDLVRGKDYQRIEEYSNDNVQMLSIIEKGGLSAEVAKTRYDLNLENIKYIQRDFSTDLYPGSTFSRSCGQKPCIFRITAFEIKRPEGWEDSDENSEAPFNVETPLFPGR